MAVVNLSEGILKDTADAIREMTGDNGAIKPVQFPDLIRSIETGPAVESITIIDKSKVAFQPGEEATYSVSVLPEYANQSFTAVSSDESVATVVVNENGTITVKALENESMTEDDEFAAAITVKAGKRDPKSDTLSITVKLVTIQDVDKNNVDLDNLTKIVQQGLASEYLKLGDELSIAYNGAKMPMRVVGFADAVVRQNGTDVTVPAIQMEMKYCAAGTTDWAANGSVNYSTSKLKTYIDGQIQPKFNSDFLACLGETKVKFCTRSNGTDVSYCKLFAPSMAELGVTNASYNTAQQASIEGPAFQYYQGATDTKRVKQAIDATGSAQYYWTRSLYAGNSNYFGRVYASGAPNDSFCGITHRAVAACNFIGKSA